MTTVSTNTPVSNSTVADFRAWCEEFHQMLLSVGLIQHTDTGQVDFPTTVIASVPAINTYPYYKVYRFNDSLQATYPIFIRINFGTAGVAGTLGIQVGASNNTNGSGTLTGVGYAPGSVTAFGNIAPGSTAVNRRSMAAGGEGYVWIVFKHGYNTSTRGIGFLVTRSVDASGNINGAGIQLYGTIANNNPTCLAGSTIVAEARVSGMLTPDCLLPNAIQSSVVGTDVQFWKHYTAQPRMRCNPFVLTTNLNDTPFETTRSLAVLGSIPRTYVSAGATIGTSAGHGAGNNNSLMLIWE